MVPAAVEVVGVVDWHAAITNAQANKAVIRIVFIIRH